MIKLTMEVDILPVNFTGIAEDAIGNKFWYKNGQFHREDGPAIEWYNGSKSWYKEGQKHRLDGPAAELASGNKFWYQNDKLHRLDGPACEYDGANSWFIDGIKYSEDNFNKMINNFEGKKYKLVLTDK